MENMLKSNGFIPAQVFGLACLLVWLVLSYLVANFEYGAVFTILLFFLSPVLIGFFVAKRFPQKPILAAFSVGVLGFALLLVGNLLRDGGAGFIMFGGILFLLVPVLTTFGGVLRRTTREKS